MPPAVSFEEAAALPVAYGTAHRMLITHGTVNKGERVLVLGASGGVGTGCVMLAKLLGAEVIACASSDDYRRRRLPSRFLSFQRRTSIVRYRPNHPAINGSSQSGIHDDTLFRVRKMGVG